MTSGVQVPKRTLGKTNIEITPIGLGMMEFSGGGGLMGAVFPTIDQEEKNAAVKAGLDGGINWFDTAELYGAGVSEASLSTALKAAGKSDHEVVVATKWWPFLRTARNISRTIEDRLRFLNGYSIGLYMVHQPFSFSSVEAEIGGSWKDPFGGHQQFQSKSNAQGTSSVAEGWFAAGGKPGALQFA